MATTTKVVQMETYFSIFVTEEANEMLMEKFQNGNWKRSFIVLRTKSPRLDGYPIEFFSGFYKVVGEDLLRVL
jgi:hypothetical protein